MKMLNDKLLPHSGFDFPATQFTSLWYLRPYRTHKLSIPLSYIHAKTTSHPLYRAHLANNLKQTSTAVKRLQILCQRTIYIYTVQYRHVHLHSPRNN